MSIQRDIRTGIVYGVKAWVAYGVAEFAFLSLLCWLLLSHWVLTPLHWRLTAVLFAAYAVVGVATGAVCGAAVSLAARCSTRVRELPAAARFNAAASLSILLIFGIRLPGQRLTADFVWRVLALCLLLGVLAMLGAAAAKRWPWTNALASPWTVSMALVGVLWLAQSLPGQGSRTVRLTVAALYLPGLLLVSVLLPQVRRAFSGDRQGRRPGGRPMYHGQVSGLSQLILPVVVVAGCAMLGRGAANDAPRATGGAAVGQGRPNVVLITLDTVRADHLSVYGYQRDTTPNLREFAGRATRYTHAISTADMTLASHASIFTGLYPSQHGAHYAIPDHPWGRPLNSSFQTLAETLRDAGYSTMGVVSNYAYVGRFVNMDQGFERYDDPAPVPVLDWGRRYFIRQTIRGILTNFFSTSAFDAEYRRADEITPRVFASLADATRRGKPFFLFVNYMDAHWPFIPPAPYDRLYPGKDESLTTPAYYEIIHEVLTLKRSVTEHERQHLLSQYDGAIAFLDDHLGRVISRLKELGLYENSLIIITADHGEAFGERSLVGHLVSVYQEEIHVPLLVKFPGEQDQRVVDELTSGVDLMPTVLDVLGLPVPPGLEGRSLRQLRPGEPRVLISESFPNPFYMGLNPARFERQERAIFSGDLKLVSSTRGKRELYDWLRDPGEKENLCTTKAAACAGLEAGLQRWIKSVRPQSASFALSRDALERLRSLGYIQ